MRIRRAVSVVWHVSAASEMNTMDLTIYLLILIAAFVGIVVWVFGRKRKARFEKDARIPFDGKP